MQTPNLNLCALLLYFLDYFLTTYFFHAFVFISVFSLKKGCHGSKALLVRWEYTVQPGWNSSPSLTTNNSALSYFKLALNPVF